VNTHCNDRLCYKEQDAFIQLDTSEIDSSGVNTISVTYVTYFYDARNPDGRPAVLRWLQLC
jgi:hypothetical protein